VSIAGGIGSAGGLGVRTAVEGIAWPAILPEGGAHLLALNFQLERSQWWPPETMRRHQLLQLRALLAHAVAHVPHYRAKPYRGWLNCSDTAAWAAFRELPLLTRRIAQAGGDAFFAASLPKEHGAVSQDETSGSTGVPLRYRATSLAGFFWNALVMREHFWHRRDFSARHAFIRSRPEQGLAPTWGPPSNQIFACGESANLPISRSLPEKREWLRAIDPHYLMTTPSTLKALAQSALEQALPLPRLREARTVGETVTGALRELVRQAWGVGIVDSYSSSECGLLAAQCPLSGPLSGHYHAQSEWAIVEVLDAGGRSCEEGEIGRIVVTPLHNFAMPLVRYDTGDYAEAGGACPCGRGLPTLRRILGRHRNRLFHPDGEVSWPNLSSLPWQELAPGLRRFQLRQHSDLSLLLRYEAGERFTPDECARISDTLRQHLRCTLPLAFEQVAELPLSVAGKLEDFVSEGPDGRAAT